MTDLELQNNYINSQFEVLEATKFLWDIQINDGVNNKTNHIKINHSQLEAIKNILKRID